jgi:hypothetical protein
LFQTIFCLQKQLSYATALCSFTREKPWTKEDIIPAAGLEGNGYACGPKNVLYLLVVDENLYDLFPHEVYAINCGRKQICPNVWPLLVNKPLDGVSHITSACEWSFVAYLTAFSLYINCLYDTELIKEGTITFYFKLLYQHWHLRGKKTAAWRLIISHVTSFISQQKFTSLSSRVLRHLVKQNKKKEISASMRQTQRSTLKLLGCYDVSRNTWRLTCTSVH